MAPVIHPGRLLKREVAARNLSANRLSPDIGAPPGRITDDIGVVEREKGAEIAKHVRPADAA
jgi:antitoxin HigA-1